MSGFPIENRRPTFIQMSSLLNWLSISTVACILCLLVAPTSVQAQFSSYADAATDVSGVTGTSVVSLGVPDYQFINDAGLGFGGTNTDVFDVGESVELRFPVPLRNIPTQHDLVLSAFVGGLGATDNATVQVEVSSDGINYSVVDTFDTEEARISLSGPQIFPFTPEVDFEGVKHFFVDFGVEDFVTDIRLTNLAGTAEGLRLDAVEGLHPEVNSDHAFEIRFDRYRADPINGRFFVRIKNIGDVGGVPIREFRMTRSPAPGTALEDTEGTLFVDINKQGNGIVGESMICAENCIDDNGPLIPFSRHAWSVDGVLEAPPGVGLDPGQQVRNPRSGGGAPIGGSFDTDHVNNVPDYLLGMTFQVTFADGFVHDFSYDNEVTQGIGSLYQKYQYSDVTPSESLNLGADYYQFVDVAVPAVPTLMTPLYWVLAGLVLGCGGLTMRVRSR